MKTILFTILLLTLSFYSNAQWIQQGLDIDGEAAGDQSAFSISMPDTNTVAIGAPQNDGNGLSSGHVRVYRLNNNSWIQKGSDIDGEAASDESGHSVSMNDLGDRLAIGAPRNDGNGVSSGHVRVYEWTGTAWIKKGSDIDGEAADDQFGTTVCMPDANTFAAGAPFNDGNGNRAGHVRVYNLSGTNWVQKGSDIDGDSADFYSGGSISMPDSNTIAIGAEFARDSGIIKGHVKIYIWNGSSWIQKGNDIIGEAMNDNFGHSVSMSDSNTVAIGAPENDGNGIGSGHVRIFRWNGTNWIQKGIDIDGEAIGDQSGYSVSMPDSNTVAIGSLFSAGNGTNSGRTRVFQWTGSSWKQKGSDIDGEAAFDFSGNDVSMPDRNTVAIAALENSGNGFDAGHVRVYEFTPCTMTSSIASKTNVTCIGVNNGSITVSVDSGAMNYNYYWSDSSSTINVSDTFNTISGLVAGQYFVTISDANNCTIIDSITISVLDTIDVTVSQINGLNLSANDTSASYQWIDCNNGNSPIVGDTNRTFTANSNGTYAVVLTKKACTDTSACIQILTVGLNATSNQESLIKVYPNPNHGSFTISVPPKYMGKTYQIFDVKGSLVKEGQFTNQTSILDLNAFGKRVYYLQISEEGIREKIVTY